MKTINKIVFAALAVISLGACNNKVEYKSNPMVAIDCKSKEIKESSEGVKVAIPVHLYNTKEACTVAYSVTPINATEGKDYVLDDNSGVLNFAAGVDSLAIPFTIYGQPGTYTGKVSFQIDLKSASNDVKITPFNSCVVSIADLDHPLSDILGDYTADGTCGFGRNTQWPVKFTADEKDVTKVWIDYIIGFAALNNAQDWGDWSCYGIVSEDHKTITIPYLQKTDIEWTADGDFMQLCSWGVSEGAPVPDETPGDIKLVWNEQYGGFINDARITYDGVLSGKMGNYYCLYYGANSILFKKN